MNRLLLLAAAGEALAGLVLFVYPLIVIKVLLGSEIVGAGIIMSRIADYFIALGVACWPSSPANRGFYGMTTYSA